MEMWSRPSYPYVSRAAVDEGEWWRHLAALVDERVRHAIARYHEAQAAVRPVEPAGLREVRDAVRELQQEHVRLEQQMELLVERYEQLDARFTDVLAARSADAAQPGVATARHVEHQQIADRYRTFMDQDVVNAARAAVVPTRRRRRDALAEQEVLAGHLAQISEALFAGTCIDLERLQQVLAAAPPIWLAQLAATGTELRERAGGSDPRGHWDFGYTPDAPVDLSRQLVWGTYSPGAGTAFVVTPAYVVGDRVYVPQRVATVEHLHRSGR